MASIQKRTIKDGSISFRVQVRLKGHPTQRATFSRLTDAKKWGQSVEAAIRERRYFKSSESLKHTTSELIERYIARIGQENPKRLKDVKPILEWWDKEIGHTVVGDLSRALISQKIEKLAKRTVKKRCNDTNKTLHTPISVPY